MREFRLPDVGEGVHEGELIEWLVEPGDPVTEDQPVAKVETDKALVDVPAPVDGSVRELHWAPGDVVPVGEVLLSFDVAGEVEAGDLDVESEPAGGDGTAQTDATSTATAGEESPASTGDARRDGRLFAPPSARRLARELGVEIAAVEGSGPGGRVTEEDVRAAAETAESPPEEQPSAAESDDGAEDDTDESDDGAPTSGIEAAVDEAVGAATVDSGGSDSTGRPSRGRDTPAADGESTDERTVDAAARDGTLAAPATRRVAEEEGVDLDEVPATAERDGQPFVTEEAVREYAAAQREAQAAGAEAVSGGETADPGAGTADPGSETVGPASGAVGDATGDAAPGPGAKPEEREPYRGVRRRIGEAMEESKFTAPHVTHHDEVDVTKLVATKDRLDDRAEAQGIHLTYVPFVLQAVTAALKEYPTMNAALDEEAEEIVYKRYYDLGVATATDAGLMVPVVEGVDRKGLLQIASELNELVERARDRSISPAELRGSTFTVTNVGAIGGEYATPILNPPEVGILALGQIRRKPRVVEDEETGEESIEPRSVLPLSLSIDHRVVDGAIAARFTNAVMERLAEPELLLLE